MTGTIKTSMTFPLEGQASPDPHGPIWTSPRLSSRLSILRSKRFLQSSHRLQWKVGWLLILESCMLIWAKQFEAANLIISKIILSCHWSKVWDEDLHSSTLSNPQLLILLSWNDWKEMHVFMFDLLGISMSPPRISVPLPFFFFLPLWPSSINGKFKWCQWQCETVKPWHLTNMHACLLSFHHLCAFFSASLAFFLSSFLLEPPAIGFWPETWSSQIRIGGVLIEQLPHDHKPMKHPKESKAAMPNQCRMIPKLHHILYTRYHMVCNNEISKNQTCNYTKDMPLRRTYEHHLPAFCCHNSPLNVASYRTGSQCGMCQAKKLCETLLLRIDD